jgi:hypothetical protein
VIFPDFNSSGQFKIVQTVWDVLQGKYESMELGDLSVSLSEALGISDVQNTSRATIEVLQDHLAKLPAALVVDSGTHEAVTIPANGYVDSESISFASVFTSAPVVVACFNSTSTDGAIGSLEIATINVTASGFTARLFNSGSLGRSPGFRWIAIGV